MSLIKHLYYYQKNIRKLLPTSTNIHCASLVEKYKKRDMTLSSLWFIEFIINDDLKTCKICKHDKVIHWVCFNVHRYLKKYYRKILLLFKPFCI